MANDKLHSVAKKPLTAAQFRSKVLHHVRRGDHVNLVKVLSCKSPSTIQFSETQINKLYESVIRPSMNMYETHSAELLKCFDLLLDDGRFPAPSSSACDLVMVGYPQPLGVLETILAKYPHTAVLMFPLAAIHKFTSTIEQLLEVISRNVNCSGAGGLPLVMLTRFACNRWGRYVPRLLALPDINPNRRSVWGRTALEVSHRDYWVRGDRKEEHSAIVANVRALLGHERIDIHTLKQDVVPDWAGGWMQ